MNISPTLYEDDRDLCRFYLACFNQHKPIAQDKTDTMLSSKVEF